jgi:hypothetical protein
VYKYSEVYCKNGGRRRRNIRTKGRNAESILRINTVSSVNKVFEVMETLFKERKNDLTSNPFGIIFSSGSPIELPPPGDFLEAISKTEYNK